MADDEFADVFGDFGAATKKAVGNASIDSNSITADQKGQTSTNENLSVSATREEPINVVKTSNIDIGMIDDLEKDIFGDLNLAALGVVTKDKPGNALGESAAAATESWLKLAETEQEDFLAWLGSEEKQVNAIFASKENTENDNVPVEMAQDVRHDVESTNEDTTGPMAGSTADPVQMTVLTHDGAVNEIRALTSESNHVDVECIRAICMKLGYIPQECRQEVWQRLLNVDGRKNSLSASTWAGKIEIANQDVVNNDAENIARRLLKVKTFPSEQQITEATLINQLELLITLFCKRRSIHYTAGLGETFGPLFVVADNPQDAMVFNCMYAICSDIIPHVSVGVPLHRVADARRPMLKLLMLYHDPSLSRHLEHHYPDWTNPPSSAVSQSDKKRSPGILPDSWIASLFESSNHQFDELLPIWDRIFLRNPVLPIYVVFVILAILISVKEQIILRTDQSLIEWINDHLKKCLEDISYVSDCCNVADTLDAFTPLSYKQKLIKAGMDIANDARKVSGTQSSNPSPSMLSEEENDSGEDEKVAHEQSGMAIMKNKLNESLNDIQSKLLEQLSPTSKQGMPPPAADNSLSFDHPEFFSITVCAGEVVPSVIQGRKKPVDIKIRFFVVDCRPKEQVAQGHLPTAFHLDPDALMKPDLTDSIISTLGPFRRNVHICVMGQGTTRCTTTPQSEDMLDFMARDASQINDAVLFLAKHRFPYVSVLEGGYSAVHSFLANSPAYDLSDLADHIPSECSMCLGVTASPGSELNGTEPLMSPPTKYFNTLTGALKDGKGWLQRQKSSMEKTIAIDTGIAVDIKGRRPWLTRRREDSFDSGASDSQAASPGSGILDRLKLSKSISDGGDGSANDAASSPSAEGKSVPIASFLTSKFMHSSSTKINEESAKGEEGSSVSSLKSLPLPSVANIANSSRKFSDRFISTLSSLKKDVQSATTGTTIKEKPKEAEHGDDSVFTIDDDFDDEYEEEEEETSVEALHMISLCQGMISGIKKGDAIKVEEITSLSNNLIFPCYKKKKIGGGRCAMLPRYLALSENCILVFKILEAVDGVAKIKSNHHLTELARMTFQKKNLQMITLYYRREPTQQDGEDTKAVAYQIEKRDEFITALRACMQNFAS